VTLLFPEDGIGARVFPAELSRFVTGYYRSQGVDVRPGETVDGVERRNDQAVVRLGSGGTVEADAVVAGLGIIPTTDLAENSGLPVSDGILVDDHGRVGGNPHIYAAGDVARFPVGALGKDTRVEHEDHALSHGRTVGANMAGADRPYDHLPFFYSDLFDLGYEAVGDLDPQLTTVTEWADPNRAGVVCYTDEIGKPRGFLLWGIFGKVDDARALITAGEPVDSSVLRALTS
jgi:NADPH-dependent 2,4-dienoyl-CoA reductase/sulfur reductase-like enzyme